MSNTYNSPAHVNEGVILVSQVIEDSTGETVPCRVVVHASHRTGEYVCHWQRMDDGSFFWGHYGTFEDALRSYLTRLSDHTPIVTDQENSPAFQTPEEPDEDIEQELKELKDKVESLVGNLRDSIQEAEEASDKAEQARREIDSLKDTLENIKEELE